MSTAELNLWARELSDWLDRHVRHHHHPHVPKPPLPPVAITVAWINEDDHLPDADVAVWVDALNKQVPDLQALWPHVQECTHVAVPRGQGQLPVGAVPAYLKPEIPEAPGALGYHDVAGGSPYIVIGTKTTVDAGVSISSVMSHEAVELTVDPACTAVATAPNGDVWALEVGDPVEADSYTVVASNGTDVEVSDFVGAAFFAEGPGALDHLGKATMPFRLAPGGYAIINGQQVFGGTKPGMTQMRPIGPIPKAKEEKTHGQADSPGPS